MAEDNRTSNPDNLLPCPFCGNQPKLRRAGNAPDWWLIDCVSEDCELVPNLERRARAAAIAAWNKRSSAVETSDSEVERLRSLLARAAEVIGWKSLYQKAEMGWYAEALAAEIKGEPEPENAFHGKRWYERYSSAVKAPAEQLYRLQPLCTCQGHSSEASLSGWITNPTCPIHGAENGSVKP